MNSWIVASGSRPTSIAYERTKARPKMPPGSLRDVVALERFEHARPRSSWRWQSDAARRRGARAPREACWPKPLDVRSGGMKQRANRLMLGSGIRPVKPARADFTIWRNSTAPHAVGSAPGCEAMNRPMAANPAAPAAATSPIRSRVDAANRQHRRSRPPARSRAARRRRAAARRRGFDADRKHRPGDQIVGAAAAAIASSTPCTERPIRKPGGASRRAAATGIESPRRCTPSAPQASATSRRSLTTTRVAVPRGGGEQLDDQRGQRAGFEIALADLNQIDAGLGGVPRLRDQAARAPRRRRRRAGQPPAIGHQADHRGSSCSETSARRDRARRDRTARDRRSRRTG